jgi:D-sedoheptulose 7-phosphate isomerase
MAENLENATSKPARAVTIFSKRVHGADRNLTGTATAVEELVADLLKFRSLAQPVDEIAQVVIGALRAGNKVLACGNGGSATTATHLTEELVGRYKADRRSLPAISLAADPALITCIANDFGYEYVFSRQIEGLADRGDIVVAFSTSGNSPNLLKALDAAKATGATSVALLGKTGGAMTGRADYELIVPSNSTARIQELHTLILHSWLDRIEAEFLN